VFSTWGIQSYPQFVQRKWKTLKKTEFRSSNALKTRVEFSIPGAEFGCFDTAIRFRAPIAQTCARGAPQAVEGMGARGRNPRSMLISLSFGLCAAVSGHCVSACLTARFPCSQHGFPHRFPGHMGVFNVFHNIQRGIHRLGGGMNRIECR
jgi:hypothetical protein